MTTCFVICDIGSKDSEVREHADALFEKIVIAPEPFCLKVVRGDRNTESKEIDVDVIKRVQNSELCIADLSESNANVYYELGRRDETGKPIILVKHRGSAPLPADIASCRFIEYDIEGRSGAREFRSILREGVVRRAGATGRGGQRALRRMFQR